MGDREELHPEQSHLTTHNDFAYAFRALNGPDLDVVDCSSLYNNRYIQRYQH